MKARGMTKTEKKCSTKSIPRLNACFIQETQIDTAKVRLRN